MGNHQDPERPEDFDGRRRVYAEPTSAMVCPNCDESSLTVGRGAALCTSCGYKELPRGSEKETDTGTVDPMDCGGPPD
jgi:hypothetical protein